MRDSATEIWQARRDAVWPEVSTALQQLGAAGAAPRLEELTLAAATERAGWLWSRDEQRLLAPDWFQRPELIGYRCSVRRFAGDLAGLGRRLEIVQQLGVRLLHLLPITVAASDQALSPQATGLTIDPELGDWEGLAGLAQTLHSKGISLAVDLPLDQLCAGETDPGRLVTGLVEGLLQLVNHGVELVRLSGPIPSPDRAALVRLLRSLVQTAAPAVVLIDGPLDRSQAKGVFGSGSVAGKGFQLAEHPLQVPMIFSALAETEIRLARRVLDAMPAIPASCSWLSSLQPGGELAWPLTAADTAALGLDAQAHQEFLADFYSGLFGDSFARGLVRTVGAQRRITGTLASLAGLESAELLGGPEGARRRELAIARIQLLHAVLLSLGGVPELIAGDEIGLLTDRGLATASSSAATGSDSSTRDAGLPAMDWELAADRFDPDTAACRIFSQLANLTSVRARIPAFHAQNPVRIVETGNDHILGILRAGPWGTVLGLANLSTRAFSVGLHSADWFTPGAQLVDHISGHPQERTLRLDGHAVMWLSELPERPGSDSAPA